MKVLEIYLLGQFRVFLDGRAVEIPERPAQSLFAYLSLTAGREHRREKLAGMLWPEASEANARKYLRHALWRIRRSLTEAGAEPELFLRVSDISLAVREDSPLWLDARELIGTGPENQLPESRLKDVLALYRGELLPGFYDDWTVLEREQVRVHFQGLMEMLLSLLLEQERWKEAEEWGERWITLGDVPEPAYRAVMVARARSGDRSGAVAVYQRAVADLQRELGVEPSPSLRLMYDDLAEPLPRQLARKDRLRDTAGRLRGELRPVTMLRAEIIGVTSPATTGDLESVKELLDRAMGVLVDEALSYEGTVVRVDNDGLLACFGALVVHEDDTRRALLTVLDMRTRFSDAFDDTLWISAGVEAGEILVGELGWDLRMGSNAVGRAVDLAARLAADAVADEILVGESAYEEARPSFEFGPARGLEYQGDQVHAYPLRSARAPVSPASEADLAQLAGREEELAILLDRIDAGTGGVVFVVGEAGIGKSRLIREARNLRSHVRWHQGHCASFGSNLPYHPLIEAFEDLLETQPADFAASAAALIGQLGSDQSSVLVIEDLHWADNATIALLREVLEQSDELPLLILSMRPDRETITWTMRESLLVSGRSGIAEIILEALSKSATSDLLDSIGPLPDHVKELLINRSAGNPFFAEELYRTLIDEGTLVRDDDHWVTTREIGVADVPTTIQRSILARADRLPDTERWVLQAASVLGWRIHQSVLEEVAGVAVGEPLADLAKAGFIRLQALQPEAVYAFRHSLIRDATYASLLKSDRSRLHLAAGQALEASSPSRPEETTGQLVYHFVLAGRPQRALPHATAMAEMAWRAKSPEEADTLQRALDEDPPPELTVSLLVGLARAFLAAADIEAGLSALDRAIQLARRIGDSSTMAECMANVATVRWQVTEPRSARWAYLESSTREVAATPDSYGKALLHHEAGRQHLVVGDIEGATRHLIEARRGLDAADTERRKSLESQLLNTEGLRALREGDFEEGLRLLRVALELGEQSGSVWATSRSRTNLATSLIDVYGHVSEGLACIEETREAVMLRGLWPAFVEETVHLARARWGEGNIDEGLAEIELFSTLLRGQPAWLSWNGARAPLLAAKGDQERALSAAQDGWASAQRSEDELAIRHAGLWMGRALGYAGTAGEAQSYLERAAAAAIGAPALRSEILTEWIYAGLTSSGTVREDVLGSLEEVPDLSPSVRGWKSVGIALASQDPRSALDSAGYFEEMGQVYVAWLFRFRVGSLDSSPNIASTAESARSWADEKGLVLY